jgi:hypothetical protein
MRFSGLEFVRPGASALAVISLVAIYALLVGLTLMFLAFRKRGRGIKLVSPMVGWQQDQQSNPDQRNGCRRG